MGAAGVEPAQTYLYAGGLQPLELTNAQHTQNNAFVALDHLKTTR